MMEKSGLKKYRVFFFVYSKSLVIKDPTLALCCCTRGWSRYCDDLVATEGREFLRTDGNKGLKN